MYTFVPSFELKNSQTLPMVFVLEAAIGAVQILHSGLEQNIRLVVAMQLGKGLHQWKVKFGHRVFNDESKYMLNAIFHYHLKLPFFLFLDTLPVVGHLLLLRINQLSIIEYILFPFVTNIL